MASNMRVNANDIKKIYFVDNGKKLEFDFNSICSTTNGIRMSVRNESGEMFDVNFSEEDSVEIVIELKGWS